MNFKIDVNEVDEILAILRKLYYVSNIYLNNIVGTCIEENKLKVLDEKIIFDDEIIGEIQVVHLQTAMTIYSSYKNKDLNELQSILNKGTTNVMKYTSSNVKPEKYDLAKKYLQDQFEENLSEEFIVYFSAFLI